MFSLDQALADGDAPAMDDTTRLHAGLLLNEVLEASDRAGRDIALRRLEGLSWGEIAIELRISSLAARVRFSKGLEHARKIPNRRRS